MYGVVELNDRLLGIDVALAHLDRLERITI